MSAPVTAEFHRLSRADLMCSILLALFAISLTMLWFSFDHRFPGQDEAEHIMNSMTMRDLLAHCHPFQHEWWHRFASINLFYPPFAYLVNGIFLLIFGQSRFVETLAVSFFVGLMVMAVYNTVRMLNGTFRAAILAVLCLCSYPTIIVLSHSFLLDLPQVAMTALGLMTLLWWRSFINPTWQRSVLVGLVLSCACLTKQLVAAYLIPLGIYFLLCDLGLFGKERKINWLRHSVLIGLIVVLIGLPFVICNYCCTSDLIKEISRDSLHKYGPVSYLNNVVRYCLLLPFQMSPAMLAIFLLAAFFTPVKKHLLLIPIAVMGLGGFALICATAWAHAVADQRYTATFLIATAIYSAFWLDKLFDSQNLWQRIAGLLMTIMVACDWLFFNFVPYPLPWLPEQVVRILPWHCQPVPFTDWGQSFVIETIEKKDLHKSVYLNVLINSPALNVHTFDLLLKEKGNNTIIPTSTRVWTIVGDKVQFSASTALYCQWYLLKTGSSGYWFYDKQSESNFKQLFDFICHSGKYNLVVQKTLPDNSQLLLYRRIE